MRRMIIMNKTAYDECYYDSMIQKGRYLFKLIARNTENPFQVIETYMRSNYRKAMDLGNPLYLNKTPKQILGELGVKVNLEAPISDTWDEFILEWMSDIYTYMQWKYNLPSERIVEKIRPEDLYEKYSPLHETSVANGVDKLRKIYNI